MGYFVSEGLNVEQLKDIETYVVDTLEPIAGEEILSCKERLINYNEAPAASQIPSELVESWRRSKQKGIDPAMSLVPYKLKENELNALLKDKENLIKDVLSLVYNSVPLSSNCVIGLVDRDGVILTMIGNRNIIARMEQANHCVGAIWNEDSVGTTAHTLSMYLGKPVQLLKESHYCNSIIKDNSLASSAPLIDSNGDILGAIVVVHWLDESSMKSRANSFFVHPLKWTIALANSYHQQSILKRQNYHLWIANRILESSFSVLDYGLIAIDHEGIIRNVNNEGYKLLGVGAHEIVGKGLSETFTDAGWVLNKLREAKSVHNFNTSLNGKSDKQIAFNCVPILDNPSKNITGAILRIITPETSNQSSHRESTYAKYNLDNIVGESTKVRKAINSAKIVAKNTGNVLLIGESGTGKEVFAQSIHNLYRPQGPFIAINCAAIPKNLIESELFGYEGGSFTGAERKGRIGKIELAQGGTLFLDEVGDMPLELQPVLLRVLEEKRLMRVGGHRYIPVDFRLIAATNKDLNNMVEENTFRADLYYRLSIFKINLPPLRERKDDIDLLIDHLVLKICHNNNLPIPEISPKVKSVLRNYSWPGNIRQLENVIFYSISMAEGERVELEHLPDDLVIQIKSKQSLKKGPLSMSEAEIQAIKNALIHTDNNLNDAAQLLGIGRTTLYRKLKEYKIPIKNE